MRLDFIKVKSKFIGKTQRDKIVKDKKSVETQEPSQLLPSLQSEDKQSNKINNKIILTNILEVENEEENEIEIPDELKGFNRQFLQSVNKLRTNPEYYIKQLQTQIGYYEGQILRLPQSNQENTENLELIDIVTQEGVVAVEAAIYALHQYKKNINAPPLRYSQKLQELALAETIRIKQTDQTSILSMNYTLEYCNTKNLRINGEILKSLLFNPSNNHEQLLLQLIIDDGNITRSNRLNILNEQVNFIGFAVVEHQKYNKMFYVLLSQNNIEEIPVYHQNSMPNQAMQIKDMDLTKIDQLNEYEDIIDIMKGNLDLKSKSLENISQKQRYQNESKVNSTDQIYEQNNKQYWPAEAISMKESTKLIIDDDGMPQQIVTRIFSLKDGTEQRIQRNQSAGDFQLNFMMGKNRIEVDKKLAMLDHMLSSQDFLGQTEKRALKRTLRQQHFKSLLMNNYQSERKNMNGNYALTSSEPSSPKSSVQFFPSQAFDQSIINFDQQPIYNNALGQAPSSALSTTISDFSKAKMNRQMGRPNNMMIQSQGFIQYNNLKLDQNSRSALQEQLKEQNAQQIDQENQFLQAVKQELLNLKSRLKIEITQKIQLIKEVNRYKKLQGTQKQNTCDAEIQTENENDLTFQQIQDKKSDINEDENEDKNSVYQNVSIILEDQIHFDDQTQNIHREQLTQTFLEPGIDNDNNYNRFQQDYSRPSRVPSFQIDLQKAINVNIKDVDEFSPSKCLPQQNMNTSKLSTSVINIQKKYSQIGVSNLCVSKQSESSELHFDGLRPPTFDEFDVEDVMSEINNFPNHKREKSSSFHNFEEIRIRNSSEKNQFHVIGSQRGKRPIVNAKEIDKNIYDGKYWFKKHESLIKKLRLTLDDSAKQHLQLKQLQDDNKTLRDKIKHLTTVIEKFKIRDDGMDGNSNSALSKIKKSPILRPQQPRRESVRLNEAFQIETVTNSTKGFFPMLFQREQNPEDEKQSDLLDENLQISIDMRLSYVDSAKYEEIPQKRRKSIFQKFINNNHISSRVDSVGSSHTQQLPHNFQTFHDSLFVIAEEPYSVNERSSFNRNSQNLNEKGSANKKLNGQNKKLKWVELHDLNKSPFDNL
ncbi:UNKNOWN [Stylonychia lemnae]|uniref:Uncharacterized protein n=1 Tax=Stylonychia lemnae TaxID=5949 RepID=A0A078A272_STYLE|nr:UNKNOWN [Stylonychia lemnae]|eukprot:CDW75932.1 UNKNOWN [Stylonychia lemnae]